MDSKNREELVLIFNDLFDRSIGQDSTKSLPFAVEKLKMLVQSHAESILLGKLAASLKEQLETQLREFLTKQFDLTNPIGRDPIRPRPSHLAGGMEADSREPTSRSGQTRNKRPDCIIYSAEVVLFAYYRPPTFN